MFKYVNKPLPQSSLTNIVEVTVFYSNDYSD